MTSYPCVTCREATCPDCFFDKHSGHERKHLFKELEQQKGKLVEALEPIKVRAAELESLQLVAAEEIAKIELEEPEQMNDCRVFSELCERAVTF